MRHESSSPPSVHSSGLPAVASIAKSGMTPLVERIAG